MIKLFSWWVVALSAKRIALNSAPSFLMPPKRVPVMSYLELSLLNRNTTNTGRFLFSRIFQHPAGGTAQVRKPILTVALEGKKLMRVFSLDQIGREDRGQSEGEVESGPASDSAPGAKLIAMASPYPHGQRSKVQREGQSARRQSAPKKLSRRHF